MLNNNCWALIAAAGTGQRFAQDREKQFTPILGKPMLLYSVELFTNHPEIQGVMLVTRHAEHTNAILADLDVHLCQGGTSRSQSVLRGLRAIARIDHTNPIVLVHDAARPCLHRVDLDACLDALANNPDQPLILAAKASDSLKQSTGDIITTSLDRESIWHAQTPQCAKLSTLLEAMQSDADCNATDEAGFLEQKGYTVRLLQSRYANIKVTVPNDLLLASAVLQDR